VESLFLGQESLMESLFLYKESLRDSSFLHRQSVFVRKETPVESVFPLKEDWTQSLFLKNARKSHQMNLWNHPYTVQLSSLISGGDVFPPGRVFDRGPSCPTGCQVLMLVK
jgi:hypothetical protein